ncbi:hypothetical protein [Dactylosporangium sp. NPDC049140]|uniref:hypothetical protein n=1 Tax=Dactylosporangium sp. NPDC049140 TaxID=3155647 RepID=UPI0034060490
MPRKTIPLLLALAILAGCHAPAAAPDPVSSPSVAPVDGPVAFHVRLGAGQHLVTSSPAPGSCPALSARIVLGHDGLALLTASGARCGTGDNGAPGNGRHGVYRGNADIPPDRTVTRTTTPLGEAALFTQPYYECTNSCKHYTEPVAVITLTAPADPDVRALTVVGERGTIDLNALTALVRDQLTP